jgi:hypothetical protein
VAFKFGFRLTGKRIREADAPWLRCPLGERGRIGAGIYERIARDENLQIRVPTGAGLIPDFNALRGPGFNPDAIHRAIRHFYEHAASYSLEVWTEVSIIGRFFLWLLVEFISRRMEQLNFPISSLEVAKGMSSEVVQLFEPGSGRLAYMGWLRRLKSSGHFIYAGSIPSCPSRVKRLRASRSLFRATQRERLSPSRRASRRLVWSGLLRLRLGPLRFLPRRARRRRSLARSLHQDPP